VAASPGSFDAIELLSTDENGRAIEGPMYPADRAPAIVWPCEENDDHRHLAYAHTFFRRDEHGEPMPGTVVRFFVPDYLTHEGLPTRLACELVEQWSGVRAISDEPSYQNRGASVPESGREETYLLDFRTMTVHPIYAAEAGGFDIEGARECWVCFDCFASSHRDFGRYHYRPLAPGASTAFQTCDGRPVKVREVVDA
jgi:hypothetical protein